VRRRGDCDAASEDGDPAGEDEQRGAAMQEHAGISKA
jgi:hypothetical protein